MNKYRNPAIYLACGVAAVDSFWPLHRPSGEFTDARGVVSLDTASKLARQIRAKPATTVSAQELREKHLAKSSFLANDVMSALGLSE